MLNLVEAIFDFILQALADILKATQGRGGAFIWSILISAAIALFLYAFAGFSLTTAISFFFFALVLLGVYLLLSSC